MVGMGWGHSSGLLADDVLPLYALAAAVGIALLAVASVARTRDRLQGAGIPTSVQLPNFRKLLSLSYNHGRGHGRFLHKVQKGIARAGGEAGVAGSVFPVYLRLGGLPVVNIGRHKAARAVLRSPASSKSFMYDGFASLTGRATFSADGQDHARKRFALLHTVFGGESMESLERVVNGRMDGLIARLDGAAGGARCGGAEEVDVANMMLNLTVSNIWEYLCGRPLVEEDAPEMAGYIQAQVQMRKVVWAHSCSLWFLSHWCYRHLSSLHRTERGLMDVMRAWGRKCQAAAAPGSPLANLAREPAVGVPEELADEVRLLLFAGSDTTGGTAAWTLHLLSQHPEVMARLKEELDAHLGDGGGGGGGGAAGGWDGGAVTHERVAGCAYLDAVLRETQRMFPVAPMVARMVGEDVSIGGGAHIPKGTAAQIWIWALHNDPSVWGDPGVFRPERWLERQSDEQRSSFMPFSTGGRNCAGQRFATIALRVIVARLAGRFRIDATSPGEIAPMCVGFTMLPGTRVGARFVPWGASGGRGR